MKYCYLRDKKGNALITLAYERKEGRTYYGATAISPEEEVIKRDKAKSRAVSRCQTALEKGVTVEWKDYQHGHDVDNTLRNKFVERLIELGFSKLGSMADEDFSKTLKTAIEHNKANPYFDKYDAFELCDC